MSDTATLPTQADIIARVLTAAKGKWVPMPELACESGSWNVHCRVAQLRKERGMNIENKLKRGTGHKLESCYRIPCEELS